MSDEKLYIDKITIPDGRTGWIKDAEGAESIVNINNKIGDLPDWANPVGTWITNLGIMSSNADSDPCVHINTSYFEGGYDLLTTNNIAQGGTDYVQVPPLDNNNKIPYEYIPLQISEIDTSDPSTPYSGIELVWERGYSIPDISGAQSIAQAAVDASKIILNLERGLGIPYTHLIVRYQQQGVPSIQYIDEIPVLGSSGKISSDVLPSMPATGYENDTIYGITPSVLKTIINQEAPIPTGTANHLTQFDSNGTLADGPALNLASGDTNKVLNERGTWTELSGAYELPVASASTLGGIKVGNNLSITNGVLSTQKTVFTYDSSSKNLIISYE